MRDRLGVDLHTDNAAGHTREQCRAVTLTRCDIKHITSIAKITGHTVSVIVLELDLTLNSRRHPFAGKL